MMDFERSRTNDCMLKMFIRLRRAQRAYIIMYKCILFNDFSSPLQTPVGRSVGQLCLIFAHVIHRYSLRREWRNLLLMELLSINRHPSRACGAYIQRNTAAVGLPLLSICTVNIHRCRRPPCKMVFVLSPLCVLC